LSVFAARLFRETYAGDTAASDLADYIDKNFRPERLHAAIADPCGVVFLAVKRHGAILGYAHLLAGEDMPFLNRLYVDEELRGTGLAERLLNQVRSECWRRGAATLRLSVFEKNARAIAFYRRSGFVVTGVTTFMVGDDKQTDIEMQMPICVDSVSAARGERLQTSVRQCQ
jgi:GNAT superfamily N-acetyltransferase